MKNKIVEVVIEGGVIQNVIVPPGVKVYVKNFDKDDVGDVKAQDGAIEKDDQGNEFIRDTWISTADMDRLANSRKEKT